MTHESLLNRDWENLVKRLGGAAFLERSARETGAFLQARVIKSAVDLLRLLLAYCLGDNGFRLTAAWATSMGLVNISAPALLYRLRQSGDWLSFLIDQLLCAAAPKAMRPKEAEACLPDQPAGRASFAKAGRLAAEAAAPISDVRASAAHRRHLVAVMVERALTMCHQRIVEERR